MPNSFIFRGTALRRLVTNAAASAKLLLLRSRNKNNKQLNTTEITMILYADSFPFPHKLASTVL
jgi:hypothetical protein